MPWISERNCLGLKSDWGIWDFSDKLITAHLPDNILILPNEVASKDPDIVWDFLDTSDNKVVIFSHIDPSDCRATTKGFNHNNVFWLDCSIVCFWEYYTSHNITKVSPPILDLDFLCYQRKPNHHRPLVYDILKDRNGIVTLGTMAFDINKDITCSSNITDVDYLNGNGGPITKNDVDTLGDMKTWDRCFLNIVSETRSSPNDRFYSEKTFKPMMGKRPFVTLGATSSYYKALHDKGYVTFEKDFPDVSDPRDLTKLADFLETFDKQAYYQDNLDKFEHNYQNLCRAKERLMKDQKNFITSIV